MSHPLLKVSSLTPSLLSSVKYLLRKSPYSFKYSAAYKRRTGYIPLVSPSSIPVYPNLRFLRKMTDECFSKRAKHEYTPSWKKTKHNSRRKLATDRPSKRSERELKSYRPNISRDEDDDGERTEPAQTLGERIKEGDASAKRIRVIDRSDFRQSTAAAAAALG
ncbi:uncharacterized protein G2W53_009301 [Senna tora]|uniref:Uncharacterized protein n=1 Tax=Senna tora TaxID=362788 RepID=A0A834WXU3_9FABA|nr:uncharacterized protein G2W53_009301 [Senna tora]